MIKEIYSIYNSLFNENAQVGSSSPGRINLIGEHTDYNNGYVLPAAIDKRIYAAFGKRSDGAIHMHSLDFDETICVNAEEVKPFADHTWVNYILGVVAQLKNGNYCLTGFNMVVGGDVPVGAGLSSSAAMECAVMYGLNELFQLEIEKLEMVKMAQKAEHEYAGVRCGIMDQFASVFGKKDHVIQLDCRTLYFDYKPLVMEGFKIILFDTRVKHSLANSEYNIRRKQCEAGVSIIQEHIPSVKSLRDVTIRQLQEYVLPEDSTVYRKCKYVIEENRRLLAACDDLEKGDIRSFGKRMFQTHEGLSILYEVSCKELDFLVDIVKTNPSVLGARMMGGGFGGCTINLIAEHSLEEVVETVNSEYRERFGNITGVHIINIDNGATILQQMN